eukprot:scaffold51699_cov39-Prasinocladus_malaysianus.AAC.3
MPLATNDEASHSNVPVKRYFTSTDTAQIRFVRVATRDEGSQANLQDVKFECVSLTLQARPIKL